ncbi:MAG: ribose 5-phosphate isomerase B [Deltaproteobacteria bacterium RBG_16_54_11]|jgi:RpiB/LacA/LacB family sugar-phosphate isomerase|nr:MAG: ribose 5-phosphate isomerase B [Deltaproteobacteria bacterium RBG_16_54_11]
MLTAMASDHRGFRLKADLAAFVRELGYEVEDLGCFDEASVDYPDLGQAVAHKVSRGEAQRGILICGSGIGMSIIANKFPGVRAALVSDVYSARLAKEHNNANILVLGGMIVGPGLACEMVKVWLEAEFQGGRHLKRLEKIEAVERRNFRV